MNHGPATDSNLRRENKHFRLIFFVAVAALILISGGVFAFSRPRTENPPQAKAGYAKSLASAIPPAPATTPPAALRTGATSTAEIKLPILLYHYVEHVQDKNDILRQKMNISPENLAAQIAALQGGGYGFFQVKDIPGFLAQPETLPAASVILTFDDGYEDFYTGAFPILKRYQAKATLYVVNDFIGRADYLTENQLLEISSSGLVEIGAHTLNHMDLKGKPLAEVKRQVEESKKGLEGRFNAPIETFAYPYGGFDDQAVAAVKSAGFLAAVSTLGDWRLSNGKLFVLPRLRAGQFSGESILKKLKNLK